MKYAYVILSVVFYGITLFADAKADQEKLTGIMKEFHDEMTVFRNDKGHYVARLNKDKHEHGKYPLQSLFWSPDGIVFHPIETGSSEGKDGGTRMDIFDNHHSGKPKKASLLDTKEKISVECGADVVGAPDAVSSEFKPVKDGSTVLTKARFSPNDPKILDGFVISKSASG